MSSKEQEAHEDPQLLPEFDDPPPPYSPPGEEETVDQIAPKPGLSRLPPPSPSSRKRNAEPQPVKSGKYEPTRAEEDSETREEPIWKSLVTLAKTSLRKATLSPSRHTELETELRTAAREGRPDQISRLLKSRRVDIHAKSKTGWTALHIAVDSIKTSKDIPGTVNCLLDHGADPGRPGPNGWSTLHFAANKGQFEVVSTLLQRCKFDINARTQGRWTALEFAASRGHAKVVTLLLTHGAKHRIPKNGEGGAGTGILHLAARNGYLEVVAVLLDWPGVERDRRDKCDKRPIDYAFDNNHGRVVGLFLRKDPKIPALHRHNKGTWLHKAARRGKTSVLETLLELKLDCADIDAKDPDGYAALHLAATHGPEESVGLLLARRADPQITTPEGQMALHLAAGWGMAKELAALVKQDEGMNRVNSTGQAAIHLACQRGHAECVSILLRKGVDLTIVDKHGYTPFMLAAMYGKVEVMRKILTREKRGNHMPTPSVLDPMLNQVIIPLLCAEPVEIDMLVDGCTALHYAAKLDQGEVLEMLLENGADASIQDNDGRTALDLALGEKRLRSVAVLFEGDWAADTRIQEILTEAVAEPDTAIIESILENCPAECLTSVGSLALSEAALANSKSIMKDLLKRKYDINSTHAEGQTPLYVTALRGDEKAMKLVLSHEPDPNIKTASGSTALMEAVKGGHRALIPLLLNAGVNLEEKDNEFRTALHLAVTKGDDEIVSRLLAGGADVHARDIKGLEPLDLAVPHEKKPRIVKLLREATDAMKPTQPGKSSK